MLSHLVADLSIDRRTAARYLDLLEEMRLIRRLPGLRSKATDTERAVPTLHMIDPILVAPDPAGINDTRRGALLESFVVNEIASQLEWVGGTDGLYHWRDRRRHELDLVIEHDNGFIAIEIKYSESCGEPEPPMRERYDTLSTSSELFIDPDDPALRRNPIQQMWRLHMLGQSMIDAGLYDAGAVVVIAPRLNDQVQRAVSQYRTHLAPPTAGKASFINLPLEDAIAALALAGAPDMARAITTRYVDFSPIHDLI